MGFKSSFSHHAGNIFQYSFDSVPWLSVLCTKTKDNSSLLEIDFKVVKMPEVPYSVCPTAARLSNSPRVICPHVHLCGVSPGAVRRPRSWSALRGWDQGEICEVLVLPFPAQTAEPGCAMSSAPLWLPRSCPCCVSQQLCLWLMTDTHLVTSSMTREIPAPGARAAYLLLHTNTKQTGNLSLCNFSDWKGCLIIWKRQWMFAEICITAIFYFTLLMDPVDMWASLYVLLQLPVFFLQCWPMCVSVVDLVPYIRIYKVCWYEAVI